MDDRPESRYSPIQTQQVLKFIAQRMKEDHTRDLAWWQIFRWAPAGPRILASMLAAGLLGMILGGLAFVPSAGLGYAFGDKTLRTGLWNLLLQWLVFGLGVGLPFGFGFGHGGREPRRVRKWRDISWWPVLTAGLAYGLASALASVLARLVFSLVKDLTASPRVGQLVGQLVGGLVVGLLLGLKLKRDSPQEPVKSRHKNRVFVIVTTIVAMIVTTIVAMIMVGIGFWFWFVIMAGIAAGIAVWFVFVLVVWFRFGLTPRLASRFVAGFADGEGRSQGPLESWHADRVFGVVTGLALMLALGLVGGLVFGLVFGFRSGFVFLNLALGGLVVGLVYGITSSVTWSTTLAWLQLQRSHHVPAVGLMPFLEDARKQGVLCTNGAVYQFQDTTLTTGSHPHGQLGRSGDDQGV